MSKANPERAINALLPQPIEVQGTGLVVKPLTLGRYAILEAIKSPMLSGAKTSIMAYIPSLYVVTHDFMTDYDLSSLYEKAFQWADTIPPGTLGRIVEAVRGAIDVGIRVVDNGKPSKKKAVTAG